MRRAEGEALAVVKQAEAKAAVVRLGAEATLFQELKRAEGELIYIESFLQRASSAPTCNKCFFSRRGAAVLRAQAHRG